MVSLSGRERFQELLILILSNVTRETDIRLRLLPVKDMAHAHRMMHTTSSRDGEGLKVIVDLDFKEFEEYLKQEVSSLLIFHMFYSKLVSSLLYHITTFHLH